MLILVTEGGVRNVLHVGLSGTSIWLEFSPLALGTDLECNARPLQLLQFEVKGVLQLGREEEVRAAG